MDFDMRKLDYYYAQYWADHGDRRFHESPLFGGGPWQMLTFVTLYLVGATLVGPYVMRRRPPIKGLLWLIRIYNAFMVIFNTYLFVEIGPLLDWGLGCWFCGKSMEPFKSDVLYLFELLLLSRYFDFFDTLFFVCRKKFDHLSLLHVLHHSTVPIVVWFGLKFSAAPFTIYALYINFVIHIFMYSYYLLSTFPSLKSMLWWKKYITTMQIIQFCSDIVHSGQVIYYPYCSYPFIAYVELVYSLAFLYLFYDFYKKSYANRNKSDAGTTNGHVTRRPEVTPNRSALKNIHHREPEIRILKGKQFDKLMDSFNEGGLRDRKADGKFKLN